MSKFLIFFQTYGFLIILLNCWGLLLPDFSPPRAALLDLDLDSATASRSGSNSTKQILWLTPLFIYLLCFLKEDVGHRIPQDRLFLFFGFLALIVICFISIIWSDFKWLTLKRIIFQVVFLLSLSIGIFYSIKLNSFVSCVNLLFYIVLFVSLVTVLNGSGFQDGLLLGWTQSKNNFGAYILALISLFFLTKYYYDDELKAFFLKLGILFLFLIASSSKTSIALGLLLLVFTYAPYVASRITFVFLMFSFSVLFILIPFLSTYFDGYWDISYLMEPETLTGRGQIWDSLYYGLYNQGKLFFGHGYGAYFGTKVIPEALDDTWSYIRFLNSAHNGYIEILLQFGAVLSLLVMYFIYKLVCYSESSICFLVAAIVLIHNVTESSIFRDQHVMWSLMVLLICIGVFNREKLMPEINNDDGIKK